MTEPKVGPELDRAVAEAAGIDVSGMCSCDAPVHEVETDTEIFECCDECGLREFLSPYSRNLSAIWALCVERAYEMSLDYWSWEDRPDKVCDAYLRTVEGGPTGAGEAPTAEEALCRAFLAAQGE